MIDVYNPALSAEASALDRPGEVSDVEVMGDLAYVTDVDATTAAFGPDGAPLAHWRGLHFEEVNGDGLKGLLARFRAERTVYGDRVACLAGEADRADRARIAISFLSVFE